MEGYCEIGAVAVRCELGLTELARRGGGGGGCA